MANLLLLKRRQMSCTLELYWFCALPTTDNGPVKMTIYQHSQQDPAAGKDPLHGSHAAYGCCKRALQSESMYAQLVDVMSTLSRIVTHNRLLDGSLENVTCARGTNHVKLSAWRRKSGLFSRFSSLSRLHKVARHQMRLIRVRCSTQKGPSTHAKQCSIKSSVWPK